MGYAAPVETTLSEISGPNFAQFAALSAIHNDGWGIATNSGANHSTVIVEPSPAIDSAKFLDSAEHLKSDAALLHFRWATAGLEVKEENTHPFTYGEYSFIHNGGVMPKEALDQFIDDDLFALLKGVINSIRQIRSNCAFSSLNSMILTPKYYLVVSEHDNSKIPGDFPGDYYELFYRQDSHGVLVASSGWNQDGWQLVPNHRLLVVDRTTLEVSLLEI